MDRFVDLPVSVFDNGFTLNPYDHLEELYPRADILGFHSEGKHFLFRHDDCNAVLKSHACRREPLSHPEWEALEARYARDYPNRHFMLTHNFNIGKEDLKTKALLIRLIGAISEAASFEIAEPTFRKLDKDDENDAYIDEISTLPLKILMDTAGIPTDDDEIRALYDAGCVYLQAFDNTQEENIAACDEASRLLLEFVQERFSTFRPGSLIHDFVQGCRDNGLSEDLTIGNIIGPLIISASNTMGISSAFLFRNLVRFPQARARLKEQPDLLEQDNTLIEFLRRDNHVKSLSRQAHEAVRVGDFAIEEGETVYLFFPGANLDPAHWDNPLELDFGRDFSQGNHIVFGGAKHVCIGKVMGINFLRHMAKGFLRYLPDDAVIHDEHVEMDGGWITERIIKQMPIELAS